MTSLPILNQEKDHLLTLKNSAFIIIDYQTIQIACVASTECRTLVTNVVALAKFGKLYDLPLAVHR